MQTNIITKYDLFINEALKYQMRVGDYVICGGNFKGIVGAKGKTAKITNRRYEHARTLKTIYTLQFEEPIIDKRGEAEVETNTIEINQNQIKNLTHILAAEYERKKAGFTMRYESSEMFNYILRTIGFSMQHKYYDISYFDVDKEKDDTVSFLPQAKYEICMKDGDDPYKTKHRQSTRVGRILRRLNEKWTDQQQENFVNAYKASWNILIKDQSDKIQVVTGDKITYWYNCKRYNPGGGTLNSSCMRGETQQPRVAFYSKHPDKIALCILLDDKKQLLARALIWRLDEPEGVIFMDRIYYVKPEHGKILEMYAAKHNMKTKISGYNNDNKMVINIDYDGSKESLLPYLDTMHPIWKEDGSNPPITKKANKFSNR